MKLAVLLASHNHPERVAAFASYLKSNIQVPYELFVVESGSLESRVGPYTTLWVRDEESRGNAFGHCLALQHARLSGEYDYVWVLTSDLEFDSSFDSAAAMIALLEREPRMAIVAPTLSSRPSLRASIAGWKPIATSESLGFIMRMAAIDDVGFLNPKFRYGWGAMDELAYDLYRRGWFLARAQGVACRYLPSSTQGHDLAFDEYWKRARRFAFEYYRERYGGHWDELFWSVAQHQGPEINAFREHRCIWAGAFTPEELLERGGGDLAPSISTRASRNEATPATRRGANAVDPWPLATDAPYRVLAWPDYGDEKELENLFDVFARALVGRSDACLCLRFDAAIDGEESVVVERLQRAYHRTLGAEAPLEILLVDDVLEPATLLHLGAAVIGFACLPSSAHGVRQAFLEATQTPVFQDGEALRSLLVQIAQPIYGRDTLDSVDFALVRAIGELHPWSAPAVLGNLAVRPGLGTSVSEATIEKLVERKKRAIVTPIVERFALEGARILEIGAAFGHCAAHFVAHGAKHVVLVEDRIREQKQAELYWGVNEFLPRDDWRVIDTAIENDSTWDELSRLGQFEIVIWTDALRHANQLATRAKALARLTARILIVDLSSPDGASLPHGLEDQVSNALRQHGFDMEAVTWTPPSANVDENSLRTVLVARKPKVIRVVAAPMPAGPLRTPKAIEPAEMNPPRE